MKRILLMMALVCSASIVRAQSSGDLFTVPGTLPFYQSSASETIRSFEFKDGKIVIEREITRTGLLGVCNNNGCSPGTSTERKRETYGLGADGTLRLLKTEEATRIPAQAERWEYPAESGSTLPANWTVVPGQNVSITIDNKGQVVTVTPKIEKKDKK